MSRPPLEVWGGLEGTVNRVQDRFFDQCARNGHDERPDDLERFASLGIRALRYPVLWEKIAPEGLAKADWRLADERLPRLRELGVRPIAGLVHHGSGPRDTSLIDPAFPERLAEYARAVAERFDWIEEWTPINEPLTTARFSALYGHWYPHTKDVRSFARALLNQCRGVVLSMRAIREVNPAARLIQTDDIGHTTSTPHLAYQANFENERRWLAWDLLCGRVDREHMFYPLLLKWGATEKELAFFRENATPPDVVGLNYYLTSDRHLDERMERYPAWSHGGNDREHYTDIEAVRVWGPGAAGHETLLRRAWERYRLPVAFTEVHLGCTREEQLRWLMQSWNAAKTVQSEGADVRAITVWSLLGAFDWNTLVTCEAGFYEPGVFDVRGRTVRPTALATMVEGLAKEGQFEHPVLDSSGWWTRPERLFYPPVGGEPRAAPAPSGPERPVMIVGSTGTLGRAFARLCGLRGLSYRLVGRREVDIAVEASVAAALERHQPWAVINAAGYVRVDEAESDTARCHRENVLGPTVLAAACALRGIRLVTFSSDLVFDGAKGRPYFESDAVAPLNVYGRTKAEAERAVLGRMPNALVVRTAAFFGPWDTHNFVSHALHALERGDRPRFAEDSVVSPTYVPDLVHATLDLLLDGVEGICHLSNGDAVSWAELARMAARQGGLDPTGIQGCSMASLGLAAMRPPHSALSSDHGRQLPALEDALARYFSERERPEEGTAGGRRTSCGVCGGSIDASDGDGRCRLHR